MAIGRLCSAAVRGNQTVIEQIAEIYGNQPFTSKELRQHGIPGAFIKQIKYFHGAKVVERVAVDAISKVATWRLTDAAMVYLERTKEVRHEYEK